MRDHHKGATANWYEAATMTLDRAAARTWRPARRLPHGYRHHLGWQRVGYGSRPTPLDPASVYVHQANWITTVCR